MRQRALALSVATLSVAACVSACFSTKPDYVASTRETQCDLRSRLVRRGFPENLDALIAGSCTVTRTEPMRGPDFTSWLAGGSSAITDCNTLIPIPFWTEKSPEGKITKVHFCPEFCMDLMIRLKDEIKNDLVCEEDAGLAGAAATTAPNNNGAADGGLSFVRPMAGSSGTAAASGGIGAAGVGGSVGAAATGAAGASAAAGASGAADASGSAGASGAAEAAGGSAAAGASGAAGSAGAAQAAGSG